MNAFRTVFASLLLSLLMLGGAAASEKVNINTADAETLARVLTNVGPSKAEQIVAHRAANGPFKSADELAMVKGIGLATIERNRDRIQVGAPQRRATPATAAAASSGSKR
ncbi:ComEA family DNA-binding protein [Luteimonas dalianensis]|uniref:ComEA family DNA-binding protein n=1 Tax=Luteimonas dalianensis TaxID=1148196 RepID=UPI003BF09501